MNLKTLRNQIDKIDRELLRLINRRLECATAIGEAKKEAGQEVFDPAREMDLLEKLHNLNEGPLSPEALTSIFRELLSCSRSMQAHFGVAFIGKSASPAHLAARELLGSSCTFIPCKDAATALKQLEKGTCNLFADQRERKTPLEKVLSWSIRGISEKKFHLYRLRD